jgi:oligopeptide/dipeptide ABC transporter ATP-binding protein
MRQRVMIAMALSCNPSLLIADEPTTALDVTIQAQILDILLRLRREYGLAVLLITHDLGVIAEVSDRVAVMYTGKIVEQAPVGPLFKHPQHPYTRGLLRSVPNMERETRGRRDRLLAISGNVPDLLDLPRGCAFKDRCPEARDQCALAVPELVDLGEGHRVRCVLHSGT